MIRHIVLIRFRDDTAQTTMDAIFADLHRIQTVLPGILSITSGQSKSPEAMERGHMHGFVVDFTDWGALAAYQDHADHKRLGASLVAHAQGGIEGILVFDLEVLQADGPAP